MAINSSVDIALRLSIVVSTSGCCVSVNENGGKLVDFRG